jgi:hypothetical protein
MTTKIYNYSEAQRNFSDVLETSFNQNVIIRRRNGQKFKIAPVYTQQDKSPFETGNFDYPKTDISTEEMLDFLKEARSAPVR